SRNHSDANRYRGRFDGRDERGWNVPIRQSSARTIPGKGVVTWFSISDIPAHTWDFPADPAELQLAGGYDHAIRGSRRRCRPASDGAVVVRRHRARPHADYGPAPGQPKCYGSRDEDHAGRSWR